MASGHLSDNFQLDHRRNLWDRTGYVRQYLVAVDQLNSHVDEFTTASWVGCQEIGSLDPATVSSINRWEASIPGDVWVTDYLNNRIQEFPPWAAEHLCKRLVLPAAGTVNSMFPLVCRCVRRHLGCRYGQQPHPGVHERRSILKQWLFEAVNGQFNAQWT